MPHFDVMLGLAGLPGADLIQLARLAEQQSFRAIWVPEITFGDAMVMDTVIAANTKHIAVGTGVVGIFSRSPVVMAMQTYSINEFFRGRMMLGLGTQAPGYVENWHGVPYERVLDRMREYIHIARRIWTGERVTFEGKTLRIRNFQLMKPPPTKPLRIYIGAIAPRMIQLAGEIADGLFGNFYTPEYLREVVLPNLRIGAQRAGRSLDSFDVGSSCITCVASTTQAALDGVRPHVMMYVTGAATTPAYIDIVRRAGFAPEVEVINGAIQRADMKAAVELVSDDMCRTFAICGTPAQARELLQQRFEAGLTTAMLNIFPPGVYFRLNEKHYPLQVPDPTFDMGHYVQHIRSTIEAMGRA